MTNCSTNILFWVLQDRDRSKSISFFVQFFFKENLAYSQFKLLYRNVSFLPKNTKNLLWIFFCVCERECLCLCVSERVSAWGCACVCVCVSANVMWHKVKHYDASEPMNRNSNLFRINTSQEFTSLRHTHTHTHTLKFPSQQKIPLFFELFLPWGTKLTLPATCLK